MKDEDIECLSLWVGEDGKNARGRLTQGLRHRCMILFLLEHE